MLELLILQPTPFCNLDCDYCYLADRGNKARMPWTVLEAAVQRVVESPYLGEELTLVWHAGEPMVLPIDWYAEAFDRAERIAGRHTRLRQSFQTNGTLIDDDWCAFLKTRDVRVGVSYDGPRDLHDRHRVRRNGRGTHDDVRAGMRRLQDAGIPFHVIAVVTAQALGRADEVFQAMHSSGCFMVGFNFEETEGANGTSTLDGDSDAPVRAFLSRYLELSRADREAPRVRELDQMAGALLSTPQSGGGTQENEAMRLLTVGHDGGFTTWSPELLGSLHPRLGSLELGNVLHDGLEDVCRGRTFRRIDEEISRGVKACAETCPYFNVCGGGGPSNKLAEHGRFDVTETNHCRLSRQALAEVVMADLERVTGC
jgi:uncharacterized protein